MQEPESQSSRGLRKSLSAAHLQMGSPYTERKREHRATHWAISCMVSIFRGQSFKQGSSQEENYSSGLSWCQQSSDKGWGVSQCRVPISHAQSHDFNPSTGGWEWGEFPVLCFPEPCPSGKAVVLGAPSQVSLGTLPWDREERPCSPSPWKDASS